MKKGQMEIFGLVIIVLIVSIGFIFVLQYVVLQRPSTAHAEFTANQLASNTLSAMQSMNTQCNQMTYQELLEECADHQGGNPTPCQEKNVCTYAYGLTENILASTLDTWGIRYHMMVQYDDRSGMVELHADPLNEPFNFQSTSNGDATCTSGQNRGVTQSFLLPNQGTPVTTQLFICL